MNSTDNNKSGTNPVNGTQETSTVNTVKSVTVKVDENSKMKLFGLFEYFTAVAGEIKDKVFALKDDEKGADVYTDYVKQPNRGRGAATTLFTKLDPEKVYTGKVSFPGKWRSSGIFPMYKKQDGKFDFTTHGYHYSMNAEIHEQLDSHHQCNEACKQEYKALFDKTKKQREEVESEFGVNTVEGFYNFVEKLTLMGWRFDGGFVNYFKLCMHPKLKDGVTTYRATYTLESGKKARYSFYRNEIGDEIAKHKEYWNMLESYAVLDWIGSNNDLFRKKKEAQYSSTSLIKSQIRLFLGSNGVPFNVVETNGKIDLSFKLPSVNEEEGKLTTVSCAYKKVFNGKERKSCYLKGLKIEKNPDGNYTFNYSVNGKRPQIAQLRECFLRLAVRNRDYFEKMVNGTLTEKDGPLMPSYFDFYFDLPLNVIEEPIHDLSWSEVFGKEGLRAHYSSAYPEIKNTGAKTSDGKSVKCPVDKPHNIMGIDLGQRNPFAYCIKNQNGEIVAQGHLDGNPNAVYKKYISFGKACTTVSHLIKETRNYLFGDDEAVSKDLYEDVKQLCGMTISYEDYIRYLASKRNLVNKEDVSKNQTHLLRTKEHGWVIRDCLWNLTKQYKKLNADRMHEADWRQTLYWVDALYRYIDVNKTFHNFGSYWDRSLGKKVNGTSTGFCKNIHDQINNNNDDMMKKFASELVPIIREHKVAVVAVEKLESMLGDKSRHTFDNRNYNLWPVGQLKTFLESKLTQFNVALVEVDEKNTSQICNDNWSYRDADDLYTVIDDKLQKSHADENAASNIVDRLITRHTNLYSLYMTNPKDNYYVPSSIWGADFNSNGNDTDKKGGSKRIRGFLTKLYGRSDVVFVKKDNVLVKSKVTVKELKKMTGDENTKLDKNKDRPQYWYRIDGDCWVNEGARDEIIENAAKLARESAGDEVTRRDRSQDVILPVADISVSHKKKMAKV